MIAFEVLVNGVRLCIAGVGDAGVLNAIVNCVSRSEPGDIFMSVGGLDTVTDEHVRWAVPVIGVGDEVTIRVVEADAVDPPERRYRYRPDDTVDDVVGT